MKELLESIFTTARLLDYKVSPIFGSGNKGTYLNNNEKAIEIYYYDEADRLYIFVNKSQGIENDEKGLKSTGFTEHEKNIRYLLEEVL